jgi:hypothetical protein
MNEAQKRILERARARAAGNQQLDATPDVTVTKIGDREISPLGLSQRQQEILNRAQSRNVGSDKPAPIGGVEGFARGALQSVRDIGFGAQQLGAELGARAGLVEEETAARLRKEQERRAKEAEAFMQTGAGKAGYVAGSIGSMLIPGAALGRVPGLLGKAATGLSAPSTLTGAAAGGGLLGAAQPLQEGESRLMSAGLGAATGAAGQAVAKGIGRLVTPSRSVPRPEAVKAAQRLEKAGVPVEIAEKSGSENVRNIKRYLADNPMTAAAMKRAEEQRQIAFNKAVLKTAGINADTATPEVLGAADEAIGGVMDKFAKTEKVRVTDDLLNAMAKIDDEVLRGLNPQEASPLKLQIDDIITKAARDGAITGDAYQNARRLATNLSKRPGISPYAQELREALDDALQSSIKDKSKVAAIKNARRQYRNLMRIEESLDANAIGDINVSKLATVTTQGKNQRSARLGRGDTELAGLARSARILKDAFPQSGTAPRVAAQAYGQLIPAAAATTYGAMQGDTPAEAAVMAGLGAAAGVSFPLLVRGAYRNPALQRYLLQGAGPKTFQEALRSAPFRGAATYGPVAGLLGPDEE